MTKSSAQLTSERKTVYRVFHPIFVSIVIVKISKNSLLFMDFAPEMDTKQSHKMGDEEDVVYLGEVRAGDEVEFSEDEEEIIMASWTTSHTISFQAAAGHMPFLNAETIIPEFQLIPLEPSDFDFLYVIEKINELPATVIPMQFIEYQELQIIKIEKVWNTKLISRYYQHVQHIIDETKNGPNETMLFHGSTKCLEIVKKGFDERLASSNSIFGAGVYFAEHSSKSNGYTGCGHLGCMQCPRRMILCRVALGNMYECTGAHKFAHAPPGHHSVKGFAQAGDVMYPEYVVYRGEQACPEYLITYKIVRETR